MNIVTSAPNHGRTLAADTARHVTTEQWAAVADMLRRDLLVDTWKPVRDALGMTDDDARDGFLDWVCKQVAQGALTEFEAYELRDLTEEAWW